MSEQPGRNDPCPCGSGSKYKKCCLEKDDQARAAAAATAAAAAAAAPAAPVTQATAKAQPKVAKPPEASRRVPASARRRSV